MMDEQAVRSYMGLSVRARMAVFGEDGVLKSVRKKEAGLVLVDRAASANTLDRYRSTCSYAGVPMILVPEDMILKATGRPGMAMAVLRSGFVNKLIGLLSDENGEKRDDIGGAGNIWQTSN